MVFRRQKIFDFLFSLAQIGLLFFLPLCFALFMKTNNAFELNKLVLFKVLVLFLLVLLFLRGGFSLGRVRRFWPVAAVLALSYFLSTLFSIDPALSWAGAYDHFMGLETNLYLFLFFFLLLSSRGPEGQPGIQGQAEEMRNNNPYGSRGFKQIVKNLVRTFFSWIPGSQNFRSRSNFEPRNDKKINILFFIIFISSFFVSLYALAQHFGFDPLPWAESARVRAFSTLGQPNHLGSFLVMVLPLAAYLFQQSRFWLVKSLFGVIIIFDLAALYFSLSMSSWIGLGAAIILILIAKFLVIPNEAERREESLRRENIKSRFVKFLTSKGFLTSAGLRNDRKKRPRDNGKFMTVSKPELKLGGIILAVFSFLLILFFLFLNQSAPTQTKIKNLFNPQAGSTSARLDFWSASFKAIKERPWLGYGPDTQGEAIAKFYEKKWGVHSNVNVVVNQAHNIFLDVLLTRGIAGLAVTLIFWFYIARTLFLNLRSGENQNLNLAIGASLLSYFVYLQFNYTHITNQVVFITLLVFAISVIPNEAERRKESLRRENIKSRFVKFLTSKGFLAPAGLRNDRRNKLWRDRKVYAWLSKTINIIIILFVSILSLFQVNQAIKTFKADYYFFELRQAAQNNQYILAFDYFDLIKADVPSYGFYDRQFVGIMDGWTRRFDNQLFYQMTNERLAKILPKIKTETFSDRLTRARINSSLGKQDSKNYSLAENDFLRLTKMAPEMPLVYRELGNHYLRASEYVKAITSFETALSKVPPLDAPGLNLDHKRAIMDEMGDNWTGLVKAYEGMGEEGKGEEVRQMIEELTVNK